MKCRDCKRAMKSLTCGERADTELIQEHLAGCPRCRGRYGYILPIIHSAKGGAVPPVDRERWKEFSARLQGRIGMEYPGPLGRFRSLLIWLGESRLIRFQKAAAVSVTTVALALGLAVFLSSFRSDNGQPDIAEVQRAAPESVVGDLSPDMAEVIYIFGPDGFVTGVFSGYIQPGDFIHGHELQEYEIVEALDYLLS